MPDDALARLIVRNLNPDQASAESLGAPLDLTAIADPRRLGRRELVRQVLVPALGAGWLNVKDPVHFARMLDKLPDEKVREWAYATLRANPWVPGADIPSFAQFVEDPQYLGQITLSERQRHWFEASIGGHARDWFCKPRKITLLVLVCGKGSGKDVFAAAVNAYIADTIQRMRNPWWHFGMPQGEPLDVVNVAQNQRQARRVYFSKLRRNLTRKRFQDILPARDIHADEAFFHRQMPDEEKPLESIRLHSLNSQAEAAEGFNTLAYVLDEYDAFRTKEGNSNGEQVLGTLTTSSRFIVVPPLGIIITYTRAQNGPALRALARCGNRGGDTPEWWGDLAPSWEVLLWRTFQEVLVQGRRMWTSPIGEALIAAGKIEEALQKRCLTNEPDPEMARLYRTNREKFDQMFACKPSTNLDAFFRMPKLLDEAVELSRDYCLQPIAGVVPDVTRVVHPETGRTHERVARRLEQIRLRPGTVYFLGGDAGEWGDSFALSLGHIIPPREQGQICPRCWADAGKRLQKHYVPEPIPAADEEPDFRAADWPCDFCAAAPRVPKQVHPQEPPSFWGFARPSGQVVQKPVVVGRNVNGEEVYAYRDEVVYDPVTGHTRTEQHLIYEDVFLPAVVEDLLIEWKPDPNAGRPVDFGNVRDLIVELSQHGRLGAARFDKWQSTMLVQDLVNHGIDAETLNPSNPAQLHWYGNLKDLITNHQFLPQPPHPDNPAPAKAMVELAELQLVNGTRVDHPQESATGEPGSKDLNDARSLMAHLCCEHETAHAIIDVGNRNPAVAAMQQQSEVQARAEVHRGSLVGGALRDLGIL